MAEIVIGTSLPKTGPYAETQFLQYSRAYDQWVRDVNAAGGMLGREVRLLCTTTWVRRSNAMRITSA